MKECVYILRRLGRRKKSRVLSRADCSSFFLRAWTKITVGLYYQSHQSKDQSRHGVFAVLRTCSTWRYILSFLFKKTKFVSYIAA